jgi:type II secretory pathway predicted ATPase ExeA
MSGRRSGLSCWWQSLRPPFDPWCEWIVRDGSEALALRSSAFDLAESASQVWGRAVPLIQLLNGAFAAEAGTEPLCLRAIVRPSGGEEWFPPVFPEGAVRIDGGVLTGPEGICGADDTFILGHTPEPSAIRRLIRAAEKDSSVAALLVLTGRADNWCDLHKALELAEELCGGGCQLAELLGCSPARYQGIRSTASFHRFAQGRLPKVPERLADARRLLSLAVRAVVRRRAAGATALFLSPGHQSVMETLIAHLLGGVKLVAVTGPAGVGKTTLVAAAVPLLAEQSLRVIRVNGQDGVPLSLNLMLTQILEMPEPGMLPRDSEMLACEVLISPPGGERATVVVIDNAHTLQPDALRMLAVVSGSAGLTRHVVQIVLVGRQELFAVLRGDGSNCLAVQAAACLPVDPYSGQESRSFAGHCLALAGRSGGSLPVFSEDALSEILQRGGGLPGQIGGGLEAALNAARRRGSRRVTRRTVRRALGARRADAIRRRRRPVWAASALALAVLLAFGLFGSGRLAEQHHRLTAGAGVPPTLSIGSAISAVDGQPPDAASGSSDGKPAAAAAFPAASGSGGSALRVKLHPDNIAAVIGAMPAPEPPPVSSDADLNPGAALQSAPGQEPGLSGGLGPSGALKAAGPSAVRPRTAFEPAEAALLRHANALMTVGNVSAARQVYERAANAGSGRAAVAMGKTYDPAFLARLGTAVVKPDLVFAASWYRRAAALGDPDAPRLLGTVAQLQNLADRSRGLRAVRALFAPSDTSG